MKIGHFASVLMTVVSLTALLIISSCGGNNAPQINYDDIEYPSQIRVTDPITIRVSDSLSFKGMEEKLSKTISVSPKFDYKIEILNSNTISIKPLKPLAYKTTYKVSFDMGKLFGSSVSSGVKNLQISTITPAFKYTEDKLSVYPGKEDVYYITGSVQTSDYVESKYIEDGMKVNKGNVSVKWTHSEDGTLHSFKIEDIMAEDKSYTLTVSRNYPLYDDRGALDINYTVPFKGIFMVIDSELVLEPYHIEVAFSSEIDKKQSFKDLISVPGGGKVRFSVDMNKLSIYPAVKKDKTQSITISRLIKNVKNESLKEDWTGNFVVPAVTPSVKFISKGSILPSANGMTVHFQAVNYAKVQIRVKKIYESNALQYFQESNLNSVYAYNLNNVARVVADTTFALDEPGSLKLKNISNYGIDISSLITKEKGAIYRVEIRGREKLIEEEDPGWESDYYFGTYNDYKNRVLNILVSDLGVVAKGSDMGEYTFFVRNIINTNPVSGAKIIIYNNVNQPIGECQTSGDGIASITLDDQPLTAVVTAGTDKTYIKMDNALSISLSNFDVQGAQVKKGQKGFIFGERGVWRPGDDIFITFISMLDEGVLPSGHPVTAVLSNPNSQVIQTITNNSGSNGMYAFKFKTDPSAPTGNWSVGITAGGQTYSKTIKIETIKPNKLLIDLSFGSDKVIPASSIKGNMKVNWLTGNAGKNLESRVEVVLSGTKTTFENFKDYVFEDMSRTFYTESKEIAVGRTDDAGRYAFVSSLGRSKNVPGFLKGIFTTRVFEPSGDFSIDNFNAVISPYDTYVGLNIQEEENDWGGKYLDIEKPHTIKVAAVNPFGYAASISKVEVEIYKIGWNWWWQSTGSELASYSRDSYNRPYKMFTTQLSDGKGSFNIDLSEQESGYYFIRVIDPVGGHAASGVTLVSHSYWENENEMAEGAARLQITLDKDKYNVGETAKISIPSSTGAVALVSLEKGEKIIKSFTVGCNGSNTIISLPLDGTMAPDIYASVTLVQPHNTKLNDAPIRMFGVKRINVEDPSSHLYPEIDVKDEIRPESEVTVSVKERDGRAMSYVLAVVDEGLLSLTRFKTPQPWDVFYATEALGVRTWDLYDMIIGAYGAKMEKLFAIGGDGEADLVPSKSKAERFKPVSLFYGPFTVSGKGASHKIQIPQYIGSLRVMVIATDGKAQGSAQKNVSVIKPLMVQTTMPRVISVNEEMSVPVTVFAMKENIGKVTVKISSNDAFSIVGEDTQTVQIDEIGEEMVYFKMKAANRETVGEITASAKSSADASKESLEIDVREPNPPVTVSKTILLKGGETAKFDFALAGKEGTNTLDIESSVLPPIDLDFRLKYLVGYPHGCLEQSVSSAFPQLYLSDLVSLSEEKSLDCENNIKNVISRLPLYAHSSGGFTYWPGADSNISFWSTIYATHFMIEASGKGYALPFGILNNALEYIRKRANRNDESALDKSYAFYVLALTGNAPRGAMNRLREEGNLQNRDRWYLAAAYAADGKKDVAKNIIESMTAKSSKIDPFSESFDSQERQLAIASMVYGMIGDDENAFKVVRSLSVFLNDRNHYMSTQSTAWALNAVAAYSKSHRGGAVDVSLSASGKNYTIRGDASYMQQELFTPDARMSGDIPVEITNNTSEPTFVVLSSKGIPAAGQEKSVSEGLSISTQYSLINGGYLDPYSINQGTDFIIEVKVTNTSMVTDYTNLALSIVLPSGWEYKRDTWDYASYQDFRDDRICSYFNLHSNRYIIIKIRATATYNGRFYLPATTCEAMYNPSVYASTSGGWTEVK